MTAAQKAPTAREQKIALAAARLLKIEEAKKGLIPFTEFTMPDQNDPDDVGRSLYKAEGFHHSLADALERVERREIRRLIITFPPRHGKSELTSRRLPAWLLGRDPNRHIILGTYNQPFADDFGGEVREIMQSPRYKLVFKNCLLKKGAAQKGYLGTTRSGAIYFVGRGGSATGRGGDYLLIDDPFKDSAEARSPAIRDEVWKWFGDTIRTRLMSDRGVIIIIMTRWHEDDLVGRLTDPNNPHYNEEEAKKWKVINFRAIAEEDDVLQRPVGAPLWPERFGLEHLEAERRFNPVGFEALYQQRPSPADGAFFKADELPLEQRVPQPATLRIFAASDFAVATKQDSDRTCHLIAGVDSQGVIWVLDCWWKRAPSDKSVEAMIELQRKWRPLVWWAEAGQISRSLGPFIRKRSRETKTPINIRKSPVAADKMTRAQSIQARSAQGMVRLPAGAPWAARAKTELLAFPNGRYDDFVDALAHIGLGLDRMPNARTGGPPKEPGTPEVGTFGWVKAASEQKQREERRIIALGGM